MCVCVRACVRELQYINHASPCSILLRIDFCACLLFCLIASSMSTLLVEALPSLLTITLLIRYHSGSVGAAHGVPMVEIGAPLST